jgi:hypothetical protein
LFSGQHCTPPIEYHFLSAIYTLFFTGPKNPSKDSNNLNIAIQMTQFYWLSNRIYKLHLYKLLLKGYFFYP